MMPLAVFVSLLLFYSLVSRRLERTVFTAPIVFTVAGMLMVPALPAILRAGVNVEVFLRLAEIGLVLLLFTDASRTDVSVLRSIRTSIAIETRSGSSTLNFTHFVSPFGVHDEPRYRHQIRELG